MYCNLQEKQEEIWRESYLAVACGAVSGDNAALICLF